MSIEILDSIWFTEMGSVRPIGIVRCQTNEGEIKYYIGTADGLNEELDEVTISRQGARFPNIQGDSLFGKGAGYEH